MNIVVYINGKKRYVRDRITVFEACHEAGVYIPHFCYHPKLSIPANCRMCLVEIAKAPKPVPSCATYVTDGMAIETNSEKTKAAQKGVMELLLINHPLDCPICDQGGECQLQDLAVGYGKSCSRFVETKRVVVEKQLGPLISTVMTRCIHCTRCVRFGEEIGGKLELGMIGRGEHSEIMPFIQSTIDSEISGNMIDICPVGALNSKPFRFTARTWEMDRGNGVAQHDSWGSLIEVQSIDNIVKRVLPKEREEINECWISDRDRFAYTGLDVKQRLSEPYVHDKGAMRSRRTEWSEALELSVSIIKDTIDKNGASQVGLLIGPSAVSEEALLASEFIRGLGSNNIDNRLRQRDFSMDTQLLGIPWLGCSIEELNQVDNILFIGADISRELPLLPVRLRRRQRTGKLNVYSIGSRSLSSQVKIQSESILKPSKWINELAQLAIALFGNSKQPEWFKDFDKAQDSHKELAKALATGKTAIFLGAEARHHTNFATIIHLAKSMAEKLDSFYGTLVEGANTVGCSLAGALPHHGFMHQKISKNGLNAKQMIEKKLKAYILIGCEPLDFADPIAAESAFKNAQTIHIGGYRDVAKHYAKVMLPAALFAERKGAMVSLEGNAATMEELVEPHAESRPVWKILRMLGTKLGLANFDFASIDVPREKLIAAGDFTAMMKNDLKDTFESKYGDSDKVADEEGIFERALNYAHFSSDQVTRRAAPLQATNIAKDDRTLKMHPADLEKLGIVEKQIVSITANNCCVECEVGADKHLAQGCVRAPWGTEIFAPLGEATRLEVSAVQEAKRAVAAS